MYAINHNGKIYVFHSEEPSVCWFVVKNIHIEPCYEKVLSMAKLWYNIKHHKLTYDTHIMSELSKYHINP